MGCDNSFEPAPGYKPGQRWLVENQRLNLQHGPIDLIIQADGDEQERKLAFEQAIAFFDSVLVSLVEELPLLRTPVTQLSGVSLKSVVARHMHEAVVHYANQFVTPMASVAGAVADCTLANMCFGRKLDRVAVNNGGDIALHLHGDATYTIGICDDLRTGMQNANASIDANSPVNGIATSGWQGRSHSLGIADAVTVLASSAAKADVAATLIANRIDLPQSNKVERVAASSLSPDTDLGNRLVTVDVQTLSSSERQQALQRGECYAQALIHKGLINSAILSLQGHQVVVGHLPLINWRQSA